MTPDERHAVAISPKVTPARFAYQPELDGLRAISVGVVVLAHTQRHFTGGGLGVDVFFVLSGYLITSILVNEWTITGGIDLRAFYTRRALRLFPGLLAVTVITVSSAFALSSEPWGRLVADGLGSATYTTDLLYGFGHYGALLTHTWSLAVEEQFYVIWPIVLLWLVRRGGLSVRLLCLAGLCALLLEVAAAGALGVSKAEFLPSRGLPLLVGGVAIAAARGRLPAFASYRWLLPCSMFVFLVLVVVGLPTGRLSYLGLRQCQEGVCVLVVLAAVAVRSRQAWLANRAVVWLGRRSYGVYLIHYPLMNLLMRSGDVHGQALATATVLGTLALAAASYRWVEQPFLRIKTRFERVPG